MHYYITFRSTNHAVKAEKLLLSDGMGVLVMPVPSVIKAGCGIMLRVSDTDIERIKVTLTANKLPAEYYTKDGKLFTLLG